MGAIYEAVPGWRVGNGDHPHSGWHSNDPAQLVGRGDEPLLFEDPLLQPGAILPKVANTKAAKSKLFIFDFNFMTNFLSLFLSLKL